MTTDDGRPTPDCPAEPWPIGLRRRTLPGLGPFKTPATYPKGSTILMRGRPVEGVFVLLAGAAKLSISSGEGATIILGIARPGDILGLSAAIAGAPSEITAQTLVSSQLCFIPRANFLRTLNLNGESCFQVVEMLSEQLRSAFQLIRTIGGAPSARKKLAALLVSWAESLGIQTECGIEIELQLNEEEIGQMIGASRATVSRLLAAFKRDRILSVDGQAFYLHKKAVLEDLATSIRRRATLPKGEEDEGTNLLQ